MNATKKLKALSVCVAVAGMSVIGGTLTGFVPADADTINATDAVAAVQQVAPEAVSDVAKTTSDTDTAALASVSGVDVSVPVDPSDGVQVSGGAQVAIGLPFADVASNAADSQKAGVVVYDNNNGSWTVPVAHADGTVQISTVITSANAPKRYDYPVDIPGEQAVHLLDDGSAYVGIIDGNTISAYVPAPWAKDANGAAVGTHFEVSGDVLTQIVDFTGDTAFPVIADPTFEWYRGLPTVKTTRAETLALATPVSAAKMCGQVGKVAGGAGVALCVLNLASISYNSQRAYWAGQCPRLMFGPGVVSTIPYKDSYCR
ncbi:MAG: hypothetical protein JF618_09135 [Leifsonia sp.]|nr:hypothetical protein [Leifsonia sp.]